MTILLFKLPMYVYLDSLSCFVLLELWVVSFEFVREIRAGKVLAFLSLSIPISGWLCPTSHNWPLKETHASAVPFFRILLLADRRVSFHVNSSQEGFPHSSVGKESACNAGDPGSVPGLGRSSGEQYGQPTPVFLPGEFHGLHGISSSSMGCKESDTTEAT